MKNTLLIVTALSVSPLAFSAPNEITFMGEVSANTCNVDINGQDTEPTVLLPTVSTADLTAATSYAGETTFSLNVSGCEVSAQATSIDVTFVANNSSANGNLANTGTATNVELALKRGASRFDMSSPVVDADAITVATGDTSATVDYAVEYYSHAGGATAGSVISTVQYALSYL